MDERSVALADAQRREAIYKVIRERLAKARQERPLGYLVRHAPAEDVRQLQHLIERLTILASHGRIDDRAVEEAISLAEPRDLASDTLADTEAEQIRRVLAATGGNKSRAAKILGIERKTLYRKLERMTL